MSDTKRVIIGSEANDDRRVELLTQGTTIVVPVALINEDGNALNMGSGLVTENYDAVIVTQTSLTDVYTFKTNGTSGTTVATITITYTNTAKTQMSTIVKT